MISNVTVKTMKMKLFAHKGCAKCRSVKQLLQSILPELGLQYKTAIAELDIGNSDVLADLMMLNTECVPTLSIGDGVLTGEQTMDEAVLRDFLKAHIKKLTG